MQPQHISQLALGDAKFAARGAEIGHASGIFPQAYQGQADYSRANSTARCQISMRARMKNPVLAANVAALRRHLNLKQEVFAERVGSKQSSVSKWENRGDMPEAKPLAAMAELAGCTVAQFIDRPWTPPSPSGSLSPDIPPSRSVDSGETVEITSLDLSVSMGPGTPIEDFVESEPVMFDLAMLRMITRTAPSRLRFIRGIGDSMEPKLLTGDRILVDTTERQLGRFDGYYWITLWGAHGLKRLRPAGPNKVEVVSVNPDHANIVVDADELTIEGRALWFAREL